MLLPPRLSNASPSEFVSHSYRYSFFIDMGGGERSNRGRLALYIAQRKTGLSNEEIGRQFGGIRTLREYLRRFGREEKVAKEYC
jgi:hypothetical protein